MFKLGSIASWIERNYSSRRGFLKTIWEQLKYYLGFYRKYEAIDWKQVNRLVFVCKGNICRSAYAEAVARGHGVEAISCGIDTILHAPANKEAQEMAKKHGYRLDQHQTTPVMYTELRPRDLVVAMEPWQADFLEKHLTRQHQYTLLCLWAAGRRPYLHDPYDSSEDYFDKCFTLIDKNVEQMAGRIKQAGAR